MNFCICFRRCRTFFLLEDFPSSSRFSLPFPEFWFLCVFSFVSTLTFSANSLHNAITSWLIIRTCDSHHKYSQLSIESTKTKQRVKVNTTSPSWPETHTVPYQMAWRCRWRGSRCWPGGRLWRFRRRSPEPPGHNPS